MTLLTLSELSHKTGITLRALRYTVDHKIVSLPYHATHARGNPRSFSEFSAFAIACAARLIEQGLRRSVVRQCMEFLLRKCHIPGVSSKDPPLSQAFWAVESAELEVADSANIRLLVRKTWTPLKYQISSGVAERWTQAATGAKLDADYRPLSKIWIDVKQLRDRVRS